ncbi:mechanosensitive ion channel domain-containing protein [Pedococcus sp. NPDC057267]|uniref:mechanosensitive ion channel domain-containing protein n=1 Tax=Pedococcus sp. NPDC057267 TaxID=3346077 RepID=UPI003641F896
MFSIGAGLRRSATWAATAAVALVAVPFTGGVHAAAWQWRLTAFGALVAFAALSAMAVRSLARELSLLAAVRGGPAAGGAVRLLVQLTGVLVVTASVLVLAGASLQKLALSGAITGVILGVAGQQSLANLFAGVVLLFSRPFAVGDWVVVHSGALGGTYEGRIEEVGLAFTRLVTSEGPLVLPNASVVSAATGRRTPPQSAAA